MKTCASCSATFGGKNEYWCCLYTAGLKKGMCEFCRKGTPYSMQWTLRMKVRFFIKRLRIRIKQKVLMKMK